MRVQIEIQCYNAAFDGDHCGDEVARMREMSETCSFARTPAQRLRYVFPG